MKALRVGLVDLDTSHPENWVPILRELGHQLVGVFDGGTVWPEGHAARFAERFSIPRVHGSPEQMVDDVDLAIIHSVNWDVHVSRAQPFVQAGKAVLIDKPIVGNLRDAYTLLDWERQGARISGGSSARFARQARDYLSQDVEERGEPHVAFLANGVDEFNYAIHAYAGLVAIMGPGVHGVRTLGTASEQMQVEVRWPDGRRGLLSVGRTERHLPCAALVVSNRSISQFTVGGTGGYNSLLEALLPYYAGEAPAPFSVRDLLEPELTAMAARESLRSGGHYVPLTDLRLDDPGYDGASFAAAYRLDRLARAARAAEPSERQPGR
ncbi:MAG: Gfo/Idh/MocA family oxidoreductase [Anaerolineae bacterium]|nr:Gfo/Idh/MocA family oxidoreductase [Anaerolineae bacterium]